METNPNRICGAAAPICLNYIANVQWGTYMQPVCLEAFPSGKWNDAPCTFKRKYVCERRGVNTPSAVCDIDIPCTLTR